MDMLPTFLETEFFFDKDVSNIKFDDFSREDQAKEELEQELQDLMKLSNSELESRLER